jgi:hypothetical protein
VSKVSSILSNCFRDLSCQNKERLLSYGYGSGFRLQASGMVLFSIRVNGYGYERAYFTWSFPRSHCPIRAGFRVQASGFRDGLIYKVCVYVYSETRLLKKIQNTRLLITSCKRFPLSFESCNTDSESDNTHSFKLFIFYWS